MLTCLRKVRQHQNVVAVKRCVGIYIGIDKCGRENPGQHTPGKQQKTCDVLLFSWGIERGQ